MTIRIQQAMLKRLRKRFFLTALLFALVYFIAVSLLPNFPLVARITSNMLPLLEKMILLSTLLIGTLQSNPLYETFLLGLTALLVGINIVFVLQSLSLQTIKAFHLTIGGEGILGAIASGCASCGTSILSGIAVGAGIGIAPYQIVGIQLLVILLLLYSLFHTLSRLQYCSITR